jgi:hypothetical protein
MDGDEDSSGGSGGGGGGVLVVVALSICSIFVFIATGITIWIALLSSKIHVFQHIRNICYVKDPHATSLKDLDYRHTLLPRATEYVLATTV